MRHIALSIFHRILLAVAVTSLIAAIASSIAHYLFAARLTETSVRNQMEDAVELPRAHFERTYAIPIMGALRLLESSPPIDNLLTSFASEVSLDRPIAERLFLSVIKSRPELYSSIRLVDANGLERVLVKGRIRLRKYGAMEDYAGKSGIEGSVARLFTRLSQMEPGHILFEGPLREDKNRFSFLAGITKLEPDIGGFGGAVIAHIKLEDYLDYLSRFRIFGHGMAWMFDSRSETVLMPAEIPLSPNPRNFLYANGTAPEGSLIYATDPFPESDAGGMFRVVFSMSPQILKSQLQGIGTITLAVLAGIAFVSTLMAWLVASRLSLPIRSLVQLTEAIGRGDLDARVTEHKGDELGQLAVAFNRMVEKLKETTVSRAYMNSVIQNSGECILTINEKGILSSINRAAEQTFMIRNEDAVGMHVLLLFDDSELLPYTYRDTYDDEKDGPLLPGNTQPVEYQGKRMDGSAFPMEVVVTQMEQGGRRERICLMRDITERKRAQEDLRKAKEAAEMANLAKSEFLANMSHELRTPLNAVIGYAQIIANQGDLSAKQRKALSTIEHSGEHLLELINDILDLAKVEAGTLELRPSHFNLLRLLENVAEIMRTRARAKGLTLISEWLSELPETVKTDERRLRQVLMNLLDNAIKYTKEGGVTLQAGYYNDRLRFMVTDTGIGIQAEHIKAIFNIFHQVRNSPEMVEGTGLGLAICRRLVTLMGGQLEVDSTPGEGSRFWFDLDLPPVSRSKLSSAPRERKLVAVRGEKQSVLIADDQADNRELLRDMLVPLGFKVYEAENGQACLQQMIAIQPDVLLVDLRMPMIRGEEVIRRLRKSAEFREMVIIAISASAFDHDRERCIAAGANDFLPKPFRLSKLLDLLSHHLDLELVFEADIPKANPVVSYQSQSVVLPADLWSTLMELAKRGDIRKLRQQAEQLPELDARYGPFAEELHHLVESFQIKKILQLISAVPHGD
jgi:PAS domain S-box-containing protein